MRRAAGNIDEAAAVLKEHKAEIVRKYQARDLGSFGSFVRGEQSKRSDVDILVTFCDLPDVFMFMNLEDYLRKLLRSEEG